MKFDISTSALLGLVMCSSSLALGEDLNSWLKRIDSKASNSLTYVQDVVLISSVGPDGIPEVKSVTSEPTRHAGFLRYLTKDDVSASLAANTPAGRAKPSRVGKNMALRQIALFTGVSALVVADANDWTLRPEGSGDQDGIVMPAPKTTDMAALDRWILDAVGYDGVVLDQQGDRLLVRGDTVRLRGEKAQGLLLENSASKLVLGPNDKKGAALIQKVESDSEHAIFQVVVAGKSGANQRIARGTKVLIERGKAAP